MMLVIIYATKVGTSGHNPNILGHQIKKTLSAVAIGPEFTIYICTYIHMYMHVYKLICVCACM